MEHPKTIGLCPKCFYIRQLTRHHIYPRRFFGGDLANNNIICWLCRRCHDKLERKIPEKYALPKSEYLEILREFLTSG